MRIPWTRNNESFIRQWLVLGEFPFTSKRRSTTPGAGLDTDYLAVSGREATVRPKPNMAHKRQDGSTVKWQTHTSFGDVVDFSGPFPGSLKENVVAYAYTTIQRAAAGKAVLSVGSDEGIRIWLNGKLVHEKREARPLTPDEDQIEVQMSAGENALLVKVEQSWGPWTFCLRVLEAGAALVRRPEIGPRIVAAEPGSAMLIVQTDTSAALTDAAEVRVEVVAAGGRIIAEKTASRGARISFDPDSWPDGVYEVRCTTRTFAGEPWATHLAWYKGNSLTAAKELLAAASRADSSKPNGFTLKMLAEMVLDRLGGKVEGVKGNPWWAIHSPLMEFEELKLEESGRPARNRPYGFVRLAYRDEIDDSPQFCRAYLPSGYDPVKKWPLVLQLHGYNPANPPHVGWWSADRRHTSFYTRYGDDLKVILLEPHGRGNTTYMGIGEKDILRCIQMAKERFSVDDDRVYLTGDSMGGYGVWYFATRHPELFAAIAPVYGGGDYHVNMKEEELAKLSPRDRFLQEKSSFYAQAESLLNLPVFINHGDADQAVNVEGSRYVVRMLQRWGYDVRYREHPGRIHEDLKAQNDIIDWFLLHKRNANPGHVRIRSAELPSASAYWVRVEQSANLFAFMLVDAEVVAPNVVRLDSENVVDITLSPGKPLVDPGKPLKVIWNGAPARALNLTEGRVNLYAEGYSRSPLQKTPQLAGPISEVRTNPFAVVVGTVSNDPAMRDICQDKAEQVVANWQDWQHFSPRIFKDTEISDSNAALYSLLLIGGPDANLITRKLAGKIPLKISADEVAIDGRSFKVNDTVIQMIYPSPWNPRRYVSVVAGTSPEGMFFWFPGDGSVGSWDFVIQDGRASNTSEGGGSTEKIRVASGFFDQKWRVNDSYIIAGDAELRAKSPLVRAPKAIKLDPAVFDACVGEYEMAPGVVVKVSREGNRFLAAPPNQAKIEIFPESETGFFLKAANVRIVFVKDAAGKVTSMLVRFPGQEMSAKKVN
jgi:pimeloyl-ACP methyl ester carboxylesterase